MVLCLKLKFPLGHGATCRVKKLPKTKNEKSQTGRVPPKNRRKRQKISEEDA